MRLHLLVARKDAMLRWYFCEESGSARGAACIKQFFKKHDGAVAITNFFDDDAGYAHIDLEQFEEYIEREIEEFDFDSRFFINLAVYFEAVGRRWIAKMENIGKLDLMLLDDAELLEQVNKFFDGYYGFSHALYPVFPVERLQQTRYPQLLDSLLQRSASFIERELESEGGKARVLKNLIKADDLKASVRGNIQRRLQFPTNTTFAEQKFAQISDIARAIARNRKLAALFDGQTLPSEAKLAKSSKQLYKRVQSVQDRYAWIKQWGYPPTYKASTFDDIIKEVGDRVEDARTGKLGAAEGKEINTYENFAEFANTIGMTQKEKDLVETMNRYEFFRTWRMEVIMRCQFLSVPLLLEAGRRAEEKGLIKKESIFDMTAPEILDLLKNGTVPKNFAERANGYALLMQDGVFSVITGEELRNYKTRLYAVIGSDERARGMQAHERTAVGGKAENLYSLKSNGINVPDYYVITTKAFREFMAANKIEDRIRSAVAKNEIYESAVASQKFSSKLDDLEKEISRIFDSAKIPAEIEEAILQKFDELGSKQVAVRSSATAEDAENFSWAGRFESYVYITRDALLERVKDVWRSLYSKTAIQYALENNTDFLSMEMAVIVQKMIDPEVSGVINTRASSGVSETMEIEAAYGQAAPIVLGEITPDHYVVSRDENHEELNVVLSRQVRLFNQSGWVRVNPKLQSRRKINKEVLQELAKLAMKIEAIYEKPQDIEWAYCNDELLVVQTRAQTEKGSENRATKQAAGDGILILKGMRGSTAVKLQATARVISKIEDAGRLQKGDILVTNAITPMWDSVALRAAAMITNEGGSTCHAIRVANERKLPAIVGTGKATSKIKDGDTIIIDTTDPLVGKVYKTNHQKSINTGAEDSFSRE